MSKINEALEILKAVGMPKAQQNERSALTLLALINVKKNGSWSKAEEKSIRIHDILTFIKINYRKTYAENTRETIRRQTLHQFEQAGLVFRNTDVPSRPTNSPNTVYIISPIAAKTIRSYGTRDWNKNLSLFIKKVGKLTDEYDRRSESNKIPIKLPHMSTIRLSPGKHNELQVQVIKHFRPNFCPNSELLYIGDTAKKALDVDEDQLNTLGIPFNVHNKLPDIVLYEKQRNHLFLIEVVTSHGPVSPKRKIELEEALKATKAKRIYVTAFPSFHEFKKHIDNVAWETEIWLADKPNHMVHFNGDKFLS